MNSQPAKRPLPSLRFPEFGDVGEDRNLTELCHRIGDGIHSTPVYSDNGECHFINGNNLSNGTIKIEPTTKRVDLEEAKKHQRPLSDDTILLSINGTIGNIAFYRHEQVILGKSACYINVDDSAANKRYIYSFLGTERVRYYFESELTGSTIRNLSLAAIRSLHLSLPSLPEQRKIANFLTAVDGRIGQLIQKKALLEDYKKGVMQQLFTQAIRFKDDHGNDFPDWEEKKLGEVSQNVGYGMNAAATEFDGVTKYIRITDIDESSNKFRPDPVTSPDERAGDQYKLQRGDIVFARTGASVGKSYLYDEADGNLAFAGFLIRFSIREDVANPVFIFLQTLTQDYWRWVKVYSMRSGQPGINAEEYKTFTIQLPTLPEQTKIADFLSAIDRKIESVATQITETQTFKRGLLQQMFV